MKRTQSAGKSLQASRIKWREIVKPITQRSNAKPKQMRVTFNTRLKSALSSLCNFYRIKNIVMSFRRS